MPCKDMTKSGKKTISYGGKMGGKRKYSTLPG